MGALGSVWLEKEVIISTNIKRGKGTPDDPIREIIQVWTKDGTLIALADPELELQYQKRTRGGDSD